MEIKPNVVLNLLKSGALIVPLFLFSCSSTKITVEILRPPDTELSAPVASVALINRVGISTAETIQYFNGRVVSQFNGVTDLLVNESFQEMKRTLNSNQFINASDTILKFIPRNGDFNSAVLPKEYAIRACRILEVDALVMAEGYTADLDVDNDAVMSTPVERTYGTFQVPYFQGEQSVYMKMMYRVYLCTDESGSMISETDVSTQVSYSTSGNTPFELNSRMVGMNSILVDASRKIGKDYAKQLAPHWMKTTRKIYHTGNDQLERAFQLVKAGKWEDAANEWYLLATTNNKKLASRASYNLILANEILGDLPLAIEWANLCLEKYHMSEVKAYLQDLEYREVELKRIKKQFPHYLF